MKKENALNLLYVAWFAFYIFLLYSILRMNLSAGLSFGIAIGVYLAGVIYSINPVSEAFLRRFVYGARKVILQDDKARLFPIFDEVYDKAEEAEPGIFKKIDLYIIENPFQINAFAMGTKTLMITRGAMNTLSDDEIRAVLAHEFGHFAHKDTVALAIRQAGNIPLTIIVAVNNTLRRILDIGLSINNSKVENLQKGKRAGGGLGGFFVYLIWFMVNAFCKLLCFIGDLILMPTMRYQEYMADKFSADCGYRDECISFLERLRQMEGEEKKRYSDFYKASHPSTIDRIARLEQYSTEKAKARQTERPIKEVIKPKKKASAPNSDESTFIPALGATAGMVANSVVVPFKKKTVLKEAMAETQGNLYLYEAPNGDGKRLDGIPKGTMLTVSELPENEKFYSTTYKGKQGYVLSKYCVLTSDDVFGDFYEEPELDISYMRQRSLLKEPVRRKFDEPEKKKAKSKIPLVIVIPLLVILSLLVVWLLSPQLRWWWHLTWLDLWR